MLRVRCECVKSECGRGMAQPRLRPRRCKILLMAWRAGTASWKRELESGTENLHSRYLTNLVKYAILLYKK